MTNHEIVQAALDRLDPSNEKFLERMKLAPQMAQIFWAALSALREETGLAIPDLKKTAEKLVKHPSAYFTELKNRGAIEKGDGRGAWSITAKAIKRLEALIAGTEAPADEEAPTGTTTKSTKATSSGGGSTKLPAKIAKKTLGQMLKQIEDDLAIVKQEETAIVERRTKLETQQKALLSLAE